ncbi:hypothetical protein EV426DRAFT_601212 [Tirmania nivea]|nr:hypothetical protein EV426DRAFT_601212 [Tirmania nivea]
MRLRPAKRRAGSLTVLERYSTHISMYIHLTCESWLLLELRSSRRSSGLPLPLPLPLVNFAVPTRRHPSQPQPITGATANRHPTHAHTRRVAHTQHALPVRCGAPPIHTAFGARNARIRRLPSASPPPPPLLLSESGLGSDLFRAGPPIFTTNMLTASRSLSVPEFLRRSTLGPDGNPFLETIRRPIFNAWSVDTYHRHASQYQLVSSPKFLHENTRQDGCGALSLENLVRRQIVRHHLSEIDEKMLRALEWYGRGKKLWEDVLASGEDSWRVFMRFCAVYGNEKDFVAMLEDGGAGLTAREGHAQAGKVLNGKTIRKTTSATNNDFRYRTQLIKDPLPPWASSIPLLTAPTPKLNGGDFSWLVCLELTTQSFNETWAPIDLQYSLGTLPNLAVLSIHGASFQRSPYRIVEDGYLSEWARHARQGQKWGSLRILVIEERLDGLLQVYRAPPRHHTDYKKVPPPPPPPRKRGLFEELDSFPKLSVVSFHFPPPPLGWGMKASEEYTEEKMYRRPDCVYPLYNFAKAGEMFEEGARRGWLSERVRDFEGTLKERSREVKELVRRAGLTDVRSLAKAGSMLVHIEAKEREKLTERDGDLGIEGGLARLLKKEKRQNQKKKEKPKPASAPILENVVPPVMVNVVFETNHTPNILPPLRNQAKANTIHNGQRSPTDQENFQERRIIFEKKRPVELPPSPPAPSPGEGKKRKSGGEDVSGVGWGEMNWSLDGAGDWDVDGEVAWDVQGDAGGGSGSAGVRNKKRKRGDELGRGMGDLLVEVLYHTPLSPG